MAARKKLGEILLQGRIIDEVQLKAALGHQKKWGCRLGTALLELGFLTEDSLTKFLSSQTRVPGIDLINARISDDVYKMIPKDVASKYGVIPVALKDTPGRKTLVVAMSNPTDLSALDELEFLTTCKIEPRIAPDSSIKKRLQQYGEEFLHTFKPTEPPPMDLTDEAAQVDKIVEERLVEEAPPEQEAPIIVDDAPAVDSAETPQEEPVALTEVSLEETSPARDVTPPGELPQGEGTPTQDIMAREEASPTEFSDMVVVSESPASPVGMHPGSEALFPAAQKLRTAPPAPAEYQDVEVQIDALRNDLTQVKMSLNTDLYIQIDALRKDLIQAQKAIEEIMEKPSQPGTIETAVQDLKNLIQVLLNFLIEKGMFTKEELVERLKKGP